MNAVPNLTPSCAMKARFSAARSHILEIPMFTDYYEILEISPNANSETIERVFRYLAMRYHPDNQSTGDLARFSELVEAHDALKDPVKRAQYDIQYKDHSGVRWKLAEESSDTKGIERDVAFQEKLLSMLYVKRRQNINDPGIGEFELERLSVCPREHLEFHLWYLKAKGWIAKLENGTLAITVEGVDRANFAQRHDTSTRLLTYPNPAS
ncbi:DnaJ domain-containing protein [Leptospira interrogans]